MPGCAVRTLQRESLADFGKMVPDFKKVVPGLGYQAYRICK